MTLAPDLAGPEPAADPAGEPAADPTAEHFANLASAPVDTIPVQARPSLTLSLTEGCETPLDALKAAGLELAVGCHPCDEAVVRLLIARVRRSDETLLVSPTIRPGTLRLG